jgi:hypothetical protein
MLPMMTDASPIIAQPRALLARGSDVAGAEWDTYGTLGLITEFVRGKR